MIVHQTTHCKVTHCDVNKTEFTASDRKDARSLHVSATWGSHFPPVRQSDCSKAQEGTQTFNFHTTIFKVLCSSCIDTDWVSDRAIISAFFFTLEVMESTVLSFTCGSAEGGHHVSHVAALFEIFERTCH